MSVLMAFLGLYHMCAVVVQVNLSKYYNVRLGSFFFVFVVHKITCVDNIENAG